MVWELSSLVEERDPVNGYHPFRSSHSPLSDAEYSSLKESVGKLKSFEKGGIVYGKGEPIDGDHVHLTNVYDVQDILVASKKQIKSELENVLKVFKNHKMPPSYYSRFPRVFEELDIEPTKDSKKALPFFANLSEDEMINYYFPYSWEDIKKVRESRIEEVLHLKLKNKSDQYARIQRRL